MYGVYYVKDELSRSKPERVDMAGRIMEGFGSRSGQLDGRLPLLSLSSTHHGWLGADILVRNGHNVLRTLI